MEELTFLFILVLSMFFVAFLTVYLFYRNERRQRMRQNVFGSNYSRAFQAMSRANYRGYRPTRRTPSFYRSGITSRDAGTGLHNMLDQYYKAERARIDKEAKEEAIEKKKEEEIKRKKELEEQRNKKEKQAYKKPGRSSRIEKAARILDELENSKKRKVK